VVRFRESRVSEDPIESRETEVITEPRVSPRAPRSGTEKTFAKWNKFLYRGVPTQKLVVEVLPLPAKYFRQFQKKEVPSRPKAPIEDGVKVEDILDRILEGEMTVMPKELWAIAPKLQTALKEILTGRRASVEGKELSREQVK